jgi:hypothetical protein
MGYKRIATSAPVSLVSLRGRCFPPKRYHWYQSKCLFSAGPRLPRSVASGMVFAIFMPLRLR